MRREMTALAATAIGIIATLLAAGCDKSDTKLHHIYITSRTDKLAPGDTTLMTVHPYPEDANTGFPNAPLVWSSSDTTVATVSQSGILTALKFGQTTISVSFGPLEATRAIIVSTTAAMKDPLMLRFLLDRFDTNGDGVLEGYETASTAGLDLTDLGKWAGTDTVDMTGLDNFVNIQTLRIERLNMTGLDLRGLSQLREVHLDACGIESLDLRYCPHLRDIRIMACANLREVTIGSMAEFGRNDLRTLHISRCDIAELDLTRCGATLWDIDVTGNPRLASLDLSVDTMLHSAIYSCATTSVTWPEGVSLDEVIRPECE